MTPPSTSSRRPPRRLLRAVALGSLALVALYLVLLIPAPRPEAFEGAQQEPFVWDQDELWERLETRFQESRAVGCEAVTRQIDSSFRTLHQSFDVIEVERLPPGDQSFKEIEGQFFTLAPKLGACLERLPEFIGAFNRMRRLVKLQSHQWDMNSPAVRQTLYRLLYGGRTAVEELMLQAEPGAVQALVTVASEPSATPSTRLFGVTLHSGDLLLSRGSASYSALIARAHDYPGNFSHVALVHVDESTGVGTTIEANIVGGVSLRPVEHYVRDDKLRMMVLRLRADLPQLLEDPMIPHRAASLALADARSRHIPYDLEMDHRDHSQMFCSEVASAAYEGFGIGLWTGMSFISGPGAISWLAAGGVRNFETQEPSDLEYDPQLRVVAEWRDAERLFHDHLDNAIIEVMLEEADRGAELEPSPMVLPVIRLAKGYSMILNAFGRVGPVPAAMTASQALLFSRFNAEHSTTRDRVFPLVADFREREGYSPPYWELLKLVRSVRGAG